MINLLTFYLELDTMMQTKIIYNRDLDFVSHLSLKYLQQPKPKN